MRQGKVPMALNLLVSMMLALVFGAAPAMAVEQCRFIQAKPEREACYQRQEAELAAKRKPEPAADTGRLDSLKQLHQESNANRKNAMRGERVSGFG